ncbi:hypothetical protein EPT55_10265, partial [Fusobacterium necrophorum]
DRRKTGLLLEFKVAKSEEELEKKAKEALEQVETKQYAAEMKEKEISDKIQKMEEELKKLPEMRSSEEYKKLNPEQKLEKTLQ